MNTTIRSINPKNLDQDQITYRFEHGTCVLCDTKLVLKHVIVEEAENGAKAAPTHRIKELAECPSCQVPARTNEYSVN